MDDVADSSADRPVEESHISTLAASIVSSPTEWKKKTPVKTYSKKVVSPSPPFGTSDPDAEGKSRYGRTRKLRPAGDFLSTDRKVSAYMKVNYEDQVINGPSTYSNSKTFSRSTHNKFKGPRSSLPARLPSSPDSSPMDSTNSSEVVTSPLDVAAPTCTETIETPLPLQECESDMDSEADSNLEYQVGDLVWAAVPGYPYWPAMITRDPIKNVTFKHHAFRRKQWHVYFFGDRGFRGWVFHQSLFPFDLETYNNKKSAALSLNESLPKRPHERKASKQQKKLFTIANRYQHSWNLAVSELQSLIDTPWDERLEYYKSTYLTKKEPVMQYWSSTMSLESNKSKKSTTAPAQFSGKVATVTTAKEPKKRMRSWSSTVSLAPDESKPKKLKSDVVPPSLETFMVGEINAPQFKLPTPIICKPPRTSLSLSRSMVAVKKIPANPGTVSTPLVRDTISPANSSALIAPLNSPSKKRPSPRNEISSKKKVKVSKKILVDEEATHSDKASKELLGVSSTPPQAVASSPAEVTPTPVTKNLGRPRKSSLPKSSTLSPLNDPSPSQSPAASQTSLDGACEPVLNASPRPNTKRRKPSQTVTEHDGEPLESPPPDVVVKIEIDAEPPNLPSPPPTVTRSGRKSVKPEVLKPTFKTEKKLASAKSESSPFPFPVIVKQEPSSPEAAQKPEKKQSENPAKERKVKNAKPSDEDVSSSNTPKLLIKKAFALFSGVKDTKLCSICFKGEKVVRCRGPCSLYMHVECSDKPRFVPGADHRESSIKSKKRPGGPGRGRRKGIKKCELDDAGSLELSINGTITKAPETDVELTDEIDRGVVNGGPSGNDVVVTDSDEVVVNGDQSDHHADVNGEVIKSENQSSGSASPVQCIDSADRASGPSSPVQTDGPLSPEQTNKPPSPEQDEGSSTCERMNELPSCKEADVPPCLEQSNSSPCPEPTLDNAGEKSNLEDLHVENMCKEKSSSDDSCQRLTNSYNGDDKDPLLLNDRNPFPESSGIPTPPLEENGKSPLREETSLLNEDIDVMKRKVANHLLPEVNNGTVETDSHLSSELNLKGVDAADTTTSDSSEKDKNGCTSLKATAKEKGWMCSLCVNNLLGPCFACGKDDGERVRCKSAICGKVFHLECMKEWPQHNLKQNTRGKLVFNCPAHTCHTCISDNPSCLTSRYLNDKLVRCMKCPTTYHHGNHCVPAGSEILTSTQIICPRHFRLGRKSLSHLNASWCFLCSVGGSLICCDLCPTAFHVECLKISPPEGPYICEDCETGRFPLYGEIVWVKLGIYRWWPARILFPFEVPPRLLKTEHVPGEFAVRFYGTYDYYWVNRGRVFLFHDGDGEKQDSINTLNFSKKAKDEAFHKGVREATEDFIMWNERRNHLEKSHIPTMKPPKYTKITSNKPVGSVKLSEADPASLTACECSPDSKDPCGPDSDCINRLLMVECDPETCPAKDRCKNRNFEKRLYPPLVAFLTESRGWGLKTLGPLKKGDFIIEYVGEMIDEEEYQRRLREMQKNKDQNFYFLTLDKDRMLDAGPKGNLARFMNHSCQPNCETQKWTVEGNTRVGLFALQDIPAESELVFNYNLMTTGDKKIECRCGAPNCAGYIGGKPAKPQTKPKDEISSKLQIGRQNKIKKKRKSKKGAKNLAKLALTNSSLNALSKADTPKCSMCNEIGATIACHESQCLKMYHLACTHLTKEPKQYTCPSHECSACRSRSQVQNCSLCINSYCSEHQEGNMVINREKGSLCRNCYESDSGSEWSTGGKDDETAETPTPANET